MTADDRERFASPWGTADRRKDKTIQSQRLLVAENPWLCNVATLLPVTLFYSTVAIPSSSMRFPSRKKAETSNKAIVG